MLRQLVGPSPSEMLRRRFSDGFQTGVIALAGAPRNREELVKDATEDAQERGYLPVPPATWLNAAQQ